MSLMPVAGALGHILNGVAPLDTEYAALEQAGGRVLASDLQARMTQPPFNASAMDGYALRAADIAAVPVTLDLAGAAAAGHGYGGVVKQGQAVRIFTGAPLPEGTDTVIIQENAQQSDGQVTILESARAGNFVRPRGYDFTDGAALLKAGTRLSSRHIMLAAAMNHARVGVRRKPVIAVLATGDELAAPGSTPGKDQIISSIPPALQTAIMAWGGKPRILPVARDNLESLAACLKEGDEADCIVTAGGASVGDHDLVHAALTKAGFGFKVLKIAMRPGKPMMFGLRGKQRVLGLPGNPVSALICARIFLKPLIDAWQGIQANLEGDDLKQLPLGAALPCGGERDHYMRATLEAGQVYPLPDQDSSLISVLAAAHCLALQPARSPAMAAGAPICVLPLDF